MKKLPSLLFIAPTSSLSGGGEISHYEIIKSAKKRGYKVHVTVPSRGTFSDKLEAENIDHTIFHYSWWGPFSQKTDAGYNLAAISRIYMIAKRNKSDCIITNSLNLPWGALAASLLDLPHVWISREMPIFRFKYLDDHYDFITAYSNVILANSKTNAEFIESKTGLKEVPYFYPYIDISRAKLNTAIKATRIVNVGNIMRDKNQLDIIEAAAILHKRKKLNTEVLFIGNVFEKDQEYFDKLQNTIAKHGLKKHIIFTGFQEDPYSLIGPNDIFVQSSGNESFGRTTVEAMKLGLVCVAADIPATREVMALGDGELYKINDVESLSESLAKLLEDSESRRQESQKAKERARRNLSETACHGPFFKQIDLVVGQHNPRHEMKHLAYQFEVLAEQGTIYEKQIADYQEIIRGYERDLSNILESKSWKAIQAARKGLRR